MPKYRSKFEASVAKVNPSASYEPIKIGFIQPAKNRSYTPDFVLPNGVIVETKGRFTYDDRMKHLWIRRQHPELDIRFVFQSLRTKIGKSKTVVDWCKANGFVYAEKTIPLEWYK